jgi:hypothetical protein
MVDGRGLKRGRGIGPHVGRDGEVAEGPEEGSSQILNIAVNVCRATASAMEKTRRHSEFQLSGSLNGSVRRIIAS